MVMRARPRGYAVAVVVVLGLAAICTFVAGRSYSSVGLQKEPFERLSYVASFDPIEDVNLGLSSNASNAVAVKPDAAIRAVAVYPTQTILVAGGQAVRSIDAPAPATLHDLVKLVAEPGWLSESGAVITLRVAVIVENGSVMSITAPTTTEVVLTVRQGVFLAVSKATLRIAGVYVHASDEQVPTSFSTPEAVAGRPFVLAVSSTMTIDRSTFRYLGRDWNSSYGLSWSKGASGSVTNSLLEHNFIGVYANGSAALDIAHNRFFYNSLYGVDPHSGSTPILVEYNTSNFNGRHGIIFSDHVTNGSFATTSPSATGSTAS
jgi:poly(beta-D-mannuronate) C5 epimerase